MAILQAGEPMLRAKADPVLDASLGTPMIYQLIDRLIQGLDDHPGVGLAAPQIGVPLRIILIRDQAEFHISIAEPRLAELERNPIAPYVLINPTIEHSTDESRLFFEGCLSVTGYRGLVRRAHSVRVRYQDSEGLVHEDLCTGWHARILQHEIDHLDGILYVDRMLTRSFMTSEHYEKWAQEPTTSVLGAFDVS